VVDCIGQAQPAWDVSQVVCEPSAARAPRRSPGKDRPQNRGANGRDGKRGERALRCESALGAWSSARWNHCTGSRRSTAFWSVRGAAKPRLLGLLGIRIGIGVGVGIELGPLDNRSDTDTDTDTDDQAWAV
jgi:hypothetical protein